MTPAEAAAAIDLLKAIAPAPKRFDSRPGWVTRRDRPTPFLELQVGLRIDGVARGVQVRLSTPQPAWESDLYGQIGVAIPQARGLLRLAPVEWRPLRAHTNPARAPAHLRLLTLVDRWHPPEHNYALGVPAFLQHLPGVAAPLPRVIATFEDYLGLCAELWNCPDMAGIPPPPWTQELRL